MTPSLNLRPLKFSLLEYRETHELELFLTTCGQNAGQENWNTADSMHYRVTPKLSSWENVRCE